MMRNSVRAKVRAKAMQSYADSRETVAFEKSRAKPEDVLARGFVNESFLSVIVHRVRAWFRRLLGLGFIDMGRPAASGRHPLRGYGTAKRRSARKWKATEPRAFGKAGRKLARKIIPIYA